MSRRDRLILDRQRLRFYPQRPELPQNHPEPSALPRCRSFLLLGLMLVGGCAVHDSRLAREGKTAFLGMQEVDLEACLGGPDQHDSFPGTDILTYYAVSSSSLGFSPPVIGGFAVNNGGYCHVTFRIDGGRVSHVIYSGEKNATLAPDAYCAPIMRSCLAELGLRRPAGVAVAGQRQ